MSGNIFSRLNKNNYSLAFLHAIQGVLILILSKTFTIPVSTSFLSFNQNTRSLEPVTKVLFDASLPLLVAKFFFLSAFFHLIIATVYRNKYEKNLLNGINKARWIEYSLSASIMMIAISMLVGIYDLGSLILIFTATAGMNLMGLVMEIYNQKADKPNFLGYWIGCFLGIVPWIVIAIYFWASSAYGTGDIPTFVYWIYVSIFIFFNCFALNMYLQYKMIGRWSDYIYGERIYMILSLVAKSLLAWQVFAGTLRP